MAQRSSALPGLVSTTQRAVSARAQCYVRRYFLAEVVSSWRAASLPGPASRSCWTGCTSRCRSAAPLRREPQHKAPRGSRALEIRVEEVLVLRSACRPRDVTQGPPVAALPQHREQHVFQLSSVRDLRIDCSARICCRVVFPRVLSRGSAAYVCAVLKCVFPYIVQSWL